MTAEPLLPGPDAWYLLGDTRDVVERLPDASVDLVLTSPPFLALRSYLPAGHPDKHREIGSEPTPADFLDTLLDLTELWRRKLAPHGSIAVELGDTYSGSGGAGGDYGPVGLRAGQQTFDGSAARQRTPGGDESGSRRLNGGDGPPKRDIGAGWPMAKSLCGIPHLYHLSLAYGRNMLRPERTTPPWRVRNVIAWTRPNPPVGALGDKFRPATSYMTIATVAPDRYFDLDAVREAVKYEGKGGFRDSTKQVDPHNGRHRLPPYDSGMSAGAPPLDWWEWDWSDGAGWVLDTPDGLRWHDAYDPELWQVSTEPYKGSHYATWPRKLLTRPIEAMVPHRVCTTCGQPSRRIVGDAEYVTARDGKPMARMEWEKGERNRKLLTGSDNGGQRVAPTLGWSDCGHDTWRRGVVLDPFGGSGTTGQVATGLGRDAILVDLDDRNADLAMQRVGMFLQVDDQRPADVKALPITAEVPDVLDVIVDADLI